MKKKTLTIAIALVLVVALAVGATYALLTDKKEITNTFSAGKIIDGNTKFTLVESNVKQNSAGVYVKDDAAGTTNKGIEYTAVLPGAPIYKDPTVSVKGLVADAYLFVVVKDNMGAGLTATVDTANWTELGNKDDQTLYAVKANGGLVKAAEVKDTALTTTILKDNQVLVANDYAPKEGADATSITFTAYLIQAAGQDDAVDAWNTNGGFGTGITAAMPTGA